MEIKWWDAKIELYEKRRYLSRVYATKSQRATGQLQSMQIYWATLLHTRATKLREKMAGVTSVLVILFLFYTFTFVHADKVFPVPMYVETENRWFLSFWVEFQDHMGYSELLVDITSINIAVYRCIEVQLMAHVLVAPTRHLSWSTLPIFSRDELAYPVFYLSAG